MAPKKRKSKTKNCSNSKRMKKDDYRSSWLAALKSCLKETDMRVLNLADKGLGAQEVKSILNFLPESHIIELNLRFDSRENEIGDLLPLLSKSKIKKLSVRVYSKQELLQLLEVVKDSEITDLNVYCHRSFDLESNEASKCISLMQNSKLTTLEFGFFSFFNYVKNLSRVQNFLNTSITTLDLNEHGLSTIDLISLYSNLDASSIVDLNLSDTKSSIEALHVLADRLRETKIEKLNFGNADLRDAELNILVHGLVGSKVTSLDLQSNRFSSLGILFSKIKETQIRALNLSFNDSLDNEDFIYSDSLRCSCLASLNLTSCDLSDKQGEALMESLRLSNVRKLDIRDNKFGLLTVKKLAENINDINLIDLDISHNEIPLEGLFILGGCLKDSKLLRLDVSNFHGRYFCAEQLHSSDLILFLKLTEGSSICQIKMNCFSYAWDLRPVYELNMLINTTLTELHLNLNGKKDCVSNLLDYLKCSTVNYLNLSHSGITDDGAVALAESLRETEIRRLNLTFNKISNQGAKVIAQCLKDSNILYMDLRYNNIEDDGLDSLAEHIKDTFITELDVNCNPGKKVLVVDTVLLENKVSVHRLNIFTQIMLESNFDEFRFYRNGDDLNVNIFLEKCMVFYKTIVDNPRAINVLLEESTSFSREQIWKLVFEDFPRQFSSFIACRIEADVTQHVRILEKAEEMGLTVIVESLLLNRPIYILDEGEGILHPNVYKLLIKYKQPICSLALEPHRISKIIEYFTEHTNVEGAQDVIKLLEDANIS